MPIALVATDGHDSTAGALRLAASWAGLDIELVTVGDVGANQKVRALLDDVFDIPPAWPHTVLAGDVAWGLARISAERDASLLVMGWDTSSHRDLVVETVRLTSVPILSVPASTRRKPHHAVLAVDLSASSVRAANQAVRWLARPAVAEMVTITDPAPHIDLLLDIVEDALRRHDEIEVGRYGGTGDPATEVLRFAASHQADLIAIGRCGRSPKRCDIGSVARAILSAAPCSVLVV